MSPIVDHLNSVRHHPNGPASNQLVRRAMVTADKAAGRAADRPAAGGRARRFLRDDARHVCARSPPSRGVNNSTSAGSWRGVDAAWGVDDPMGGDLGFLSSSC